MKVFGGTMLFPRHHAYPAIDLGAAVVAITGAARGIGLATAQAFAARGARVCLGDLDLDAAREAAQAIGPRALALPLDVTSRPSFERFLRAVGEQAGPVDVLVSNAGVMPLGRFVDEADEKSRMTLEVNVWGPILGTRLALPGMMARGRGHIVNVASMAGKFPIPGLAVYVASKSAVLGLSAVVREEVAPAGISVSAVLPTAVRTGLISGIPLGRVLPLAEPRHIARAVVSSCHTREAEITVPRWLKRYDAIMALTPGAVVQKVRALLQTDRLLTSIDERARADYERRVAGQARAHGAHGTPPLC